MYPENESKKSVLVRKNTLLLENNVIDDDILHSISCEEVLLKKKLRERLERIISSALDAREITNTDVKNLNQLFNYVAVFY